MKQTEKPATLVLNGRVYVSGALEESFPSQRCPRNPEAGTLRIHSHLDEEGLKARSRGFCKHGYSGVIRASIFDGKQWRKFMLARECQVEQRSFPNFVQRPSKASTVLRTLGLLKGKTCVHRDGAYAVDHSIVIAAARENEQVTQPSPVTGKAPAAVHTVSSQGNGSSSAAQGTLFPADAQKSASPKCQKRRAVKRSAPRRRKKKKNPDQPELF